MESAGAGLPEHGVAGGIIVQSLIAMALYSVRHSVSVREVLPLAETPQRVSCLAVYPSLCLPPSCTNELRKKVVTAGAQVSEKWVMCKKLCLASCWRLLVFDTPKKPSLYPLAVSSSVSQKFVNIPANRDAHPSLIARSSLLSLWAGGAGDRVRHIKSKE